MRCIVEGRIACASVHRAFDSSKSMIWVVAVPVGDAEAFTSASDLLL